MELSDINEDYFQVEDCATKTTYSELIRPLKRVRISMVVYHNEVLWKEHDGIKCTSVQVHSDERKTLVVFGFKRGKEQAYRGLIKRGDKDWEEINVESINETIFDTTDELDDENMRVNNNGKAGLFDKIMAFVNHYLRYNSGIPEVNKMEIKGPFGIRELGKEVVRRSNGAITHLRNTRGSQHGGTFYNKYFQVACPTFRLLRRLFRR
ncbi:hypothetical protein BEWA_028500 [Theileria equi strain WA]|uniref:Uncharacterized protein n=1 Tax=Theileria equi strain WA TaxID=1537102 RepID=L0AWS7_THEEQ|nr:hypothetical protein BEWA_028500 [Theileria equi strain WA]AFZ80000.1 hypothetical protein BEWA_028500 [Theileria equi strain WA]|eukprot:XP_004829666.1 hypothetical protein BEWA_028500 [Theileria equi strain WA]